MDCRVLMYEEKTSLFKLRLLILKHSRYMKVLSFFPVIIQPYFFVPLSTVIVVDPESQK
jgi:hypothetical protein